ncbi:unnamed protein product [Gongylonema pulchrum]|uniref:Uncharacterized protein n=1 Tax=Gongylonema pulchrum TaxID=637853 RepID=A0A183DAP3_9BILA|nr:unnamed protein product [Gongylonema pulchrum]
MEQGCDAGEKYRVRRNRKRLTDGKKRLNRGFEFVVGSTEVGLFESFALLVVWYGGSDVMRSKLRYLSLVVSSMYRILLLLPLRAHPPPMSHRGASTRSTVLRICTVEPTTNSLSINNTIAVAVWMNCASLILSSRRYYGRRQNKSEQRR